MEIKFAPVLYTTGGLVVGGWMIDWGGRIYNNGVYIHQPQVAIYNPWRLVQ